MGRPQYRQDGLRKEARCCHQKAPEEVVQTSVRQIQVCAFSMEKTKGYRQPSSKTVLGPDGHAIDWFWLKQKDSTHDAFRSQGFPCPQSKRRRNSPHAQPNICRRNRIRCFLKKASRDRRKGEGAGCQGHQRQGEDYHRVMSWGIFWCLIMALLEA